MGVEQVGDAVQRNRGLPVPGPPSITTMPESGSRMIASCSAWIVVTMSRIVDPRGAFSAASSAGSEADPESAFRSSTSSWKVATRSSGAVPASWKCRRRVTSSGVARVAQ
jgi:hypothetical protein